MKRETKEAISGVVLLGSIIIILLLMTSDGSNVWAIFGLAVLALISGVALVAFSETGWRVEGSDGEWIVAMFMRPYMGLFWHRNSEERDRREDRRDRERDAEYYKHRSK
jgi:hypothetical protein